MTGLLKNLKRDGAAAEKHYVVRVDARAQTSGLTTILPEADRALLGTCQHSRETTLMSDHGGWRNGSLRQPNVTQLTFVHATLEAIDVRTYGRASYPSV